VADRVQANAAESPRRVVAEAVGNEGVTELVKGNASDESGNDGAEKREEKQQTVLEEVRIG
jgi:hypothetical protein